MKPNHLSKMISINYINNLDNNYNNNENSLNIQKRTRISKSPEYKNMSLIRKNYEFNNYSNCKENSFKGILKPITNNKNNIITNLNRSISKKKNILYGNININ